MLDDAELLLGVAAGWGTGEPGLLVLKVAGEPAGAVQAVQHRVERSVVDSGALVDFEAVELTRVVDDVT